MQYIPTMITITTIVAAMPAVLADQFTEGRLSVGKLVLVSVDEESPLLVPLDVSDPSHPVTVVAAGTTASCAVAVPSMISAISLDTVIHVDPVEKSQP